jgi:hypothetical protein
LIAEIEQKVMHSIQAICTTEVVTANQPAVSKAAAGEVHRSSGSEDHIARLGQDPEVKKLTNSCMDMVAEATHMSVDAENLPHARAALLETVLLSEPRDLFKEISEAIPTDEGKLRFVSTGNAFKLLEDIKELKSRLSRVISIRALHSHEQVHEPIVNKLIRLCAVRVEATVETAPNLAISCDDTTTTSNPGLDPKPAKLPLPKPTGAMASSADSSAGQEAGGEAANSPARVEESLAGAGQAAAGRDLAPKVTGSLWRPTFSRGAGRTLPAQAAASVAAEPTRPVEPQAAASAAAEP